MRKVILFVLQVKPEDIDKKIEEILASTGALDVIKSQSGTSIGGNEATSLEDDIKMEDIEPPPPPSPPPSPPRPASPPDLDLPSLKEDLSEVTSTVTIKTPDPEESVRSSANPAVWKGEINMQDVADFGVTAHQG